MMLAAALAAGCRPTGDDTRSAGGDAKLEAPTPSSVTLAGLLSVVNTGYSNVQQARYLQEQSKRLGISSLDKPSGGTGEDGGNRGDPDPLSYEEGLARTKAMTREFAAQRRALEKGKPKPVGLQGTTPGLIPGKPQGGPIESAP